MLQDNYQRQQATDPSRSFIVQAPAGSGKTELLTQRFLRLLSLVSAPEQIIALTFTRKAASEMRERILLALGRAEQNILPGSSNQQLTHQFATAAIERSKALNWQLVKQPNRLKIITIDSLCQNLSHAIPLYERWAPYASISDDIQSLYKEAVRSCLQDIMTQKSWHHDISTLLYHVDNRQDQLIQLLCHVLAQRDQWLPLIFRAREQTKQHVEQALALMEQHELNRFSATIPTSLQDELFELCFFMATIENNPDSPRFALSSWQDISVLNREITRSLGELLLTKDNKLRKSFDHHVGLKRDRCDSKATFDCIKSRSKDLLAALAEQHDFLPALIRVKNLPPPKYSSQQWTILQILLKLIPLLAAHLQLAFRTNNAVDFTDISQQALLALGTEDEPTDLALYLDHSIHHLLIDEFQDTSLQQFELLTKLVQGWLPDQGKSLFVVGDPMQSIYRFRQAEVGLFLKAKQSGIANLQLEFLELCCNFRSTPTIIHWINQQFKSIFPQLDDIQTGAVSFSPSVSGKPSVSDDTLISALCFADKSSEAVYIAKLAQEMLEQSSTETVAILVRSRSQLSAIIPELRRNNIAFQGMDIEKLTSISLVQDIWILTKALLLPANRLNWLALLRSPLCGITLSDLHIIANFNPKKSIFYALAHQSELIGLSPDATQRLNFIYPIVYQALKKRQHLPLVDWLNDIFQQLHGDSILNADEKLDLEQFWTLLKKFSKNQILPDLTQLEIEINKYYSQKVSSSRLQIMTIHKSKGLEFDTVIIPGLGNKPAPQDKPLLRWLRIPDDQQEELFLLSSIRATYEDSDLLYDYLGRLNDEKEAYEQQRLLYVAATRAKKRLYLLDYKEKVSNNTFRNLLAQQTFSLMEDSFSPLEQHAIEADLFRLPLSFYTSLTNHIKKRPPGNLHPEPPIAPYTRARQKGIIAHELLQWMGNFHQTDLHQLPWHLITSRYQALGFTSEEQTVALAELRSQLSQMLKHPRGMWLFQSHLEEKNEYAVLVTINEQLTTRIIDKIFYDQGFLWVIDFKTGGYDEVSHALYQEQVNQYAELLSASTSHKIRCGLFYLPTAQWMCWEYTISLEKIG